jgi:1-acyl-sn-glycerol-3-phosphate acyltransferase
MQTSSLSLPRAFTPWLGSDVAMRSGLRVTRVGMFATETLARLYLDAFTATSLEQRARELSWVCENLCALTGVRPRVTGDVPRGPCVLVSNHVSYLDPMVLGSLVPSAPIAKSEVEHWPVVGEVARRVGVRFVKRACPHSGARILRESLRALAQGVSVMVFPEGTTTDGRRALPFKRGAFGLARLAGVPVVPAVVQFADPRAAWINDDLFLPHFARTVARPLTSVSIRFLPAIEPDSVDSTDELAALAHAQIDGHLAHSELTVTHGQAVTRAVA